MGANKIGLGVSLTRIRARVLVWEVEGKYTKVCLFFMRSFCIFLSFLFLWSCDFVFIVNVQKFVYFSQLFLHLFLAKNRC
jgi:hypothetical protein